MSDEEPAGRAKRRSIPLILEYIRDPLRPFAGCDACQSSELRGCGYRNDASSGRLGRVWSDMYAHSHIERAAGSQQPVYLDLHGPASADGAGARRRGPK